VIFDQGVTFLFVADLDVSAHFYGEVLGLDRVLDQGSCHIYRIAGESFLGLCSGSDRTPSPDGVIVTLVTGEVDQWWERLIDAGVAGDQAPRYHEEYRIYHAFVRDPDGHLIEIQEFRDPRWPAPERGLR
jgi:catechol 2,3-dioxygenase-like lactoylglutathione lyase family enzyme